MDLNVQDVAQLLQVSEKTINRWVTSGQIPTYRINDQCRFSLMEIENWLMSWQIFSPSLSQEKRGHKGGLQQFSLYRAIHKGGVYTDLPGNTKEGIIRVTMEHIALSLGADAAVLSDLLLDREELMSTAINQGVAVPHTRDFLLSGPFDLIAVVYPKEPIEYQALDGQKVHTLFFLFSSCEKRHLHLLAKLAHFTSTAEARDLLQTKPSRESLLEYIRDWESSL